MIYHTAILSLLLMVSFERIHSVPCPNHCNNRGKCIAGTATCECFNGYEGPDCSLLTCPKGPAWVDTAVGFDIAHSLATCSNMGTCATQFGTCSCNLGFEGIACERMSCPSSCFFRGQCLSMNYLARTKDKGLGTVYSYADIWDADRIFGCVCDDSFEGVDCSLRICPKGDDPMTGYGVNTAENPNQVNEQQRVSCTAAGGSFTLSFRGYVTDEIPFDANAQILQASLESLKSITNVKVVLFGVQACMEAGAAFTVEFLQEFGDAPLLVGDSSKLFFTSAARTPSLLVAETQTGTKENIYCSGRGLCDLNAGYCTCSSGYGSSNGYNDVGTRGDCGTTLSNIQSCPGIISCSGHGQCMGNPTYACRCSAGWQGADCSERVCPSDVSWFTTPTAHNVAHLYTISECSDMGICDRASGACICVAGFSGAACNRLDCVSTNAYECSGHGNCYDMKTLAEIASEEHNDPSISYGSDPNNADTWDATRIFGCKCQPGWTDYDCSKRTCPVGIDPMTVFHERQVVSCMTSLDSVSGYSATFSISVDGVSHAVDIPADVDAHNFALYLQSIPQVGKVSVVSKPGFVDALCSSGMGQFVIEFRSLHGDIPLITVTPSNAALVFFTEEIQRGSYTAGECSNRGICNPSSGICKCFEGYDSSDGHGNIGTIPDCGYVSQHVSASNM